MAYGRGFSTFYSRFQLGKDEDGNECVEATHGCAALPEGPEELGEMKEPGKNLLALRSLFKLACFFVIQMRIALSATKKVVELDDPLDLDSGRGIGGRKRKRKRERKLKKANEILGKVREMFRKQCDEMSREAHNLPVHRRIGDLRDVLETIEWMEKNLRFRKLFDDGDMSVMICLQEELRDALRKEKASLRLGGLSGPNRSRPDEL